MLPVLTGVKRGDVSSLKLLIGHVRSFCEQSVFLAGLAWIEAVSCDFVSFISAYVMSVNGTLTRKCSKLVLHDQYVNIS